MDFESLRQKAMAAREDQARAQEVVAEMPAWLDEASDAALPEVEARCQAAADAGHLGCSVSFGNLTGKFREREIVYAVTEKLIRKGLWAQASAVPDSNTPHYSGFTGKSDLYDKPTYTHTPGNAGITVQWDPDFAPGMPDWTRQQLEYYTSRRAQNGGFFFARNE